MEAISITRHGGPEVLTVTTDAPQPRPAPGQLLVQVEAAGVNYIDTYYRDGTYAVELPFIPGLEGVGRVVAGGEGTSTPAGTRVAWNHTFGSYAQFIALNERRAVEVPEGLPAPVAASALLQGMTAHYLTHDTFPLAAGDTCLITAGAGGVGLLLTQYARRAGATVITVVSSEAKAELSAAAGAHHVLHYGPDLVSEVRELTDGHGVDVTYDGVGRDTFEQSLDLTRTRGLVALFGAASGPVPPLDPQTLKSHGSLFLTRPTLQDHTRSVEELRARAGAVLTDLDTGALTITVGATYPLAQAGRAHRDLQERRTTGSLVLIP